MYQGIAFPDIRRYTEVGRPAQLLHNDTVSFKTRLQVRIPTTY
jgi:hypothetical protein